ncbi:calcium/proton exchanger [Tanacetum coccineum]
MEPILGMRYETPQQLKMALENYGVAHGYQLWEHSFQIKSLRSEHKCCRNYNLGSLVTYKWIAMQYFKEIIEDPFMPLRKMRDDIRQKFMIDYRQALLDSNPGSTCTLDVVESNNRGELLTAMGRDANNQMYPIASAVVRVENADNWGWLLHLLHDDLCLNDRTGITIISDSQKIKLLDANAYDYLIQRNPNSWSRAFFEMDRRCASFENGISKRFNRAILGPRMKPIITMLEEIRLYIMQRIVAMNKLAFSLEDTITPSIRKRLEILKEKQREWFVYPSGFQELEVRKGDQSYGVSLQHKVCQCRMWELSGIPCVHVVAAYMHVGSDLDAGVSHWYSRESWFNAYQFSIKPVFGTNMWKRTNDVPPLPPIIRKMPGRPQKKRIQAPGKTNGSQCASRGGGRSGRGDGNDGSGSGVNDTSGSGVNAGSGSGVTNGSGSGGRGGGRAGGSGKRGGGRAGRGSERGSIGGVFPSSSSRMTGQVFECILLLGTLRDISWLLEPSLVLTPHCGLGWLERAVYMLRRPVQGTGLSRPSPSTYRVELGGLFFTFGVRVSLRITVEFVDKGLGEGVTCGLLRVDALE